jgi:hypothetical protein
VSYIDSFISRQILTLIRYFTSGNTKLRLLSLSNRTTAVLNLLSLYQVDPTSLLSVRFTLLRLIPDSLLTRPSTATSEDTLEMRQRNGLRTERPPLPGGESLGINLTKLIQ